MSHARPEARPRSHLAAAGAQGSAKDSSARTAGWVLHVILLTAFVVSVVHYTDNYVRFDRYALNPDSPIQEPILIVVGWLLFTAFGVAGYVAYRRQRWWPAVALTALYSVSGLVSLVHYTDAAPSAFDGAQNTLIVADVVAGVAVVGLALWLMFRRALVADVEAADAAG
ncbi:hypothetical protein [Actinopolymorpha pittospori]|uniref:Uncharacterized protein n=1 Tax=Actinopolymorpha pittospori TaxID=648752 RepID=A0A927MXZ8_9ACTN|nr:hypothetical protein [Actinopolymorpha pittospori]MBE1605382.1 hypothetical protein [Actinopolymorpha pittospori]